MSLFAKFICFCFILLNAILSDFHKKEAKTMPNKSIFINYSICCKTYFHIRAVSLFPPTIFTGVMLILQGMYRDKRDTCSVVKGKDNFQVTPNLKSSKAMNNVKCEHCG